MAGLSEFKRLLRRSPAVTMVAGTKEVEWKSSCLR